VATPQSRRPIFVEFVGAAGAGKSFIASALRNELVRREIGTADLLDVAISKVDFRNYLIFVDALLVTSRIFPRTLAPHINTIKRLAKLNIRRAAADAAKQVVVCDEGIFQIIRALYRNSRADSMIDVAAQLRHHVELPDIVIAVDASVDTVFSRRTERNRPGDRFDRESVTRDVTMIGDTVATVKHVQGLSGSNMEFLIVDVNVSRPRSVVDELAAVIESRVLASERQ
jgi:thymidylate kinase